MSFFDSKEEVINIELTQYGKESFAKGLFDPKYYAFFDDDIIYDSSYCDITESQNEIETRILEQTVFNKPIYNFSDREKNLKSTNQNIPPNFDYKNSISTIESVNNYAPSWNIKILEGSTIQNAYITKSIPSIVQIDLTQSFINLSGSGADLEILSEYILLEIEEKNVVAGKENFELELYEMLDITDSFGNKTMNKLDFAKKPMYIKNNILLDEPIIQEGVPQNDPTKAEYYFEINADKEINTNILNGIRKNNTKLYLSRKVEE